MRYYTLIRLFSFFSFSIEKDSVSLSLSRLCLLLLIGYLSFLTSLLYCVNRYQCWGSFFTSCFSSFFPTTAALSAIFCLRFSAYFSSLLSCAASLKNINIIASHTTNKTITNMVSERYKHFLYKTCYSIVKCFSSSSSVLPLQVQ